MSQKNPAENFFENMQAAMETQRKNFQAMTEANQRAMQGWQALARRQSEMVSNFVQNNTARNGQIDGKQAYEDSFANTQELVEIMRTTAMETAEVINRRIVDSVNEIKASTRNAG